MNRTLWLSIAFGTVLLLFTGVASAETGIVPTDSEIEFLTQLLDILDTFVDGVRSLLSETSN
ncbi:hypothetical protein ABNG02_16865 [Halorubrum ejinorense]